MMKRVVSVATRNVALKPAPAATVTGSIRSLHTSTPVSSTCSTSSLGDCSVSRASIHRSSLPPVLNEPMLNFAPGSNERVQLKKALARIKSECPEIPCIVGGKYIKTGNIGKQVMPSNHQHVLCTFHQADEAVTREAIAAAAAAKKKWEEMPWEDRASIFLKAAELLSQKYHWDMVAATMLGQGKNAWQAEIDSCAEMADFWRFNVKYAQDMYATQPSHHAPGTWNRVEYRALEGFVFAISPFNFSAIGANLSSAPAMMGNVVLWKPSPTAMISNYLIYKILEEAGLPAGVINFLPGDGLAAGKVAFAHRDFAGLHFTGSTKTFNTIFSTIGSNINNYRSYPRIVGETGGKNFHFVHESADIDLVVNQTIRGAFEYSGQKCSATSRAYIPDSIWPEIKQRLLTATNSIVIGQPDEFETFVSAVIDQRSYDKIVSYIEKARAAKDAKIIVGGTYDNSKGYFVNPTIIETTNPQFVTITEEIFGPVLTVYVYPANQYKQTLKLCDETSPYALTGSIFARDRYALEYGANVLRHSAGNFYINDKSTGAVVGQQPFGGGRSSGTNDKAGAPQNLARWVSPRAIKETFVPITTWRYPSMQRD